MSETNINTTQEAAFNAWIAELPERREMMTHNELYQMICDKVGEADRETMTKWLCRLEDKLGVIVPPRIDYKWWQRFVSDPDMTVYIGDSWLSLNDDGSHKWRYMTNLQRNGEQKEDWEFILRDMSETAELQLRWFPWSEDEPEMVGHLQLHTATISTTIQLSEDNSKALSESVRELMTRHSKGISAPQARTITEIGGVFPKSYSVTEQIYTSPFLHIDDGDDRDEEEGDSDSDDGDIGTFAIKKRD